MAGLFTFKCFNTDTQELFRQLHKKNIIDDEKYIKLGHCASKKQGFNLVSEYLGISEELHSKIWAYLLEKVDWKRCKPRESIYFNEWQVVFFIELMKHNGVITRNYCMKELFTDQQISTHITKNNTNKGNLEELEFVNCIKIRRSFGNTTIFIFNPEMIQEIKEKKNVEQN